MLNIEIWKIFNLLIFGFDPKFHNTLDFITKILIMICKISNLLI